MCWLYGALGDRVRYEEEIKLAVLDLGLLDETGVDVGALRRILNELASLLSLFLLEETLTDALVNDNKRNLRFCMRRSWFFAAWVVLLMLLLLEEAVFLSHNLVELVEFLVNYHLTHRVAYTITINKNVLWHCIIKISVALECSLEIAREYTR